MQKFVCESQMSPMWQMGIRGYLTGSTMWRDVAKLCKTWCQVGHIRVANRCTVPWLTFGDEFLHWMNTKRQYPTVQMCFPKFKFSGNLSPTQILEKHSFLRFCIGWNCWEQRKWNNNIHFGDKFKFKIVKQILPALNYMWKAIFILFKSEKAQQDELFRRPYKIRKL